MPLDPRVEEGLKRLRERELREFEKRAPRSRQLFEKARRFIPGGTTYAIRFYEPYPAYIARGKGVYVWDVDGNRYIDFWMGHGANILGHAPDEVVEAVAEAIRERGPHLGYANELEVEYAEFLTRTLPWLEAVKFSNSGTEANMQVARLARAYTRRKRIVKVEGGWHGGYDALHVGVTYPFRGPETLGLPEEFIAYTEVVPYNDIEAAEKVLRRGDVAEVVVEPVLGAGGAIEADSSYLKELRRLCDQYGTLLVFDEVITGFRLAYGGGVERYGVKPDLVVYGKIIGGGFPGAGAFGGRADVMELLDHAKIRDGRRRSFHGGTFTANTVTLTAGYTTLRILHSRRSMYEEAEELWKRWRREVEKAAEDLGVKVFTTGLGTIVGLHFTEERPRSTRDAIEKRWSSVVAEALHAYARNRGVLYISERMAHFLPSLLHGREHVDELRRVVIRFLEEVSKIIRSG